MMSLVKYVPDTDLRMGWDGLSKKVPLGNLKRGEFVAFVNREQNKLKLATAGDMIAYLRLPRAQKIDPRVIQYLPVCFDGKKIDYDQAVERALRKSFPAWFENLDKKGS